MKQGTRVRLKEEAFRRGRPHLLQHARARDEGFVGGPSKRSPGMAQIYTIVHFEQCGHDHRLLEKEIEKA